MRIFWLFTCSISFWVGQSLSAQSLQAELGASTGVNWSWGTQAQGFIQQPYLTFSLQGGMGIHLTPHIGLGAGLSYFEAGTRTYFSLEHLQGPEYWKVEIVNTYALSPRIYIWYAWDQRASWLGKTQVNLGVRYGRFSGDFQFPTVNDALLTSGQAVNSQYLSSTSDHHAWWIEAGYTYELMRIRNHGLSLGLLLMVGLSPIMNTTHSYTVIPAMDSYQSQLTLRGDYLGVDLVYRWHSNRSN